MKPHNEVLKNPLKTRDDFALALKQILEPLKPFYSKGMARLELEDGYTAHYPTGVAELEGFSRVLWGIAPLLNGGFQSDFEEICLCGLKTAQTRSMRNIGAILATLTRGWWSAPQFHCCYCFAQKNFGHLFPNQKNKSFPHGFFK